MKTDFEIALNKLIQNFEKLPQLATEAMLFQIDVSKDKITDLNKEQLQDGRRADNSYLPNYSERSVKVYGKPEGRIRLYDTGDFYDGFDVKTNNQSKEIELYGKDLKTQMLKNEYRKEIIGLTPQSIEKFISLIKENLNKTLFITLNP